MAKRRKPKVPASPPPPLPNDPSIERLRHDDFDTVAAPRMVGEEIGRDRLQQTRRKADPLIRMTGGGDAAWIDRRQLAALEKYAVLVEKASYDTGSRGCLALVEGSTGTGYEGMIDHRYADRRQLERAAECLADADRRGFIVLSLVISETNQESLGEIARRICKGGLPEARTRIGRVASAAAQYFDRV